jgi:hypothetical protein
MNIHKQTKINKLLQNWPQGTVATTRWLAKQAISRQLQAKYQESGWIEAIGIGAYKRTSDIINWQGCLYAIQKQLNSSIYVGGLAAITLQGSGHYIRFKDRIQLFSSDRKILPEWCNNFPQEYILEFYQTNFLPKNFAFNEYEYKSFSITISSLERAILECLYLAPKYVDLVECYHIMQGLAGLRPDILQKLLQNCSSVKVKRLFLYMAEKADHAWLKFIDINKFDLGSGKRSLVKHGVYDAKYQITIPRELINI